MKECIQRKYIPVQTQLLECRSNMSSHGNNWPCLTDSTYSVFAIIILDQTTNCHGSVTRPNKLKDPAHPPIGMQHKYHNSRSDRYRVN